MGDATYTRIGTLVSGKAAMLAPLPARWWGLFVEMVRAELGLELEIIQARGGAAASGGTHIDGWAVDIRTWRFTRAQIEALVALARRCGASATWYRTKAQGFDPHIHLVVDSGPTWTASRYQTVAVRQGYNGLGPAGRKGLDTHPAPRPWRTGAQGITYMEDNMPLSESDINAIATRVWSATFGTETAGARLGRAAASADTAASNTRPISRGGQDVPLRQEIADAKTLLISLTGELAGLRDALAQAQRGDVDLAAVEAAAKRGAQSALDGARVTVDLGAPTPTA